MLGGIERKFRRHSFVQAMSHRAVELDISEFENHDHAAWVNPFSKAVSTASFHDLFAEALAQADRWIPVMVSGKLSPKQAHELTDGLNFSGEAVEG